MHKIMRLFATLLSCLLEDFDNDVLENLASISPRYMWLQEQYNYNWLVLFYYKYMPLTAA